MMENKNIGKNTRAILASARYCLIIIAVMLAVYLLGYMISFQAFGIRPRTLFGLVGIFTSPFIHLTLQHLISNAAGILVLGMIFFTVEKEYPFIIMMHFLIIGGLGTWIIGRGDSNHIGSSGIIYGMLGYLISMGIFMRSVKTIAVAILAYILYGGAIWGIFPGNLLISWESHLCGFLSGIITAKSYAWKRSSAT